MDSIVKRGVSGYPFHSENPFVDSLVVKKKDAIVGKRDAIIDPDLGKIKSEVGLFITKKVDNTHFVKIYKDRLKDVFDLTHTAYKMFTFILGEISSDKLHLDVIRCQANVGFKSKRSIFDGLAELLNKDFIARADHVGYYFINPAIFFNGDRFVVVETYEKTDG